MLAALDCGPASPRTVALPTGSLTIRVHDAAWPLDRLCGFAARDNPKRGFLVVSKVLGRHWPARPSEMRASAAALAARIPVDLPGPVVIVGLAETAICLAQTVHEDLRGQTGRDDILFIHSTRQCLSAPVLCRFEEAHSHASSHLIYRPDLAAFHRPRSLVLVDDEVTTGATLVGLAAALATCWPGIETIIAASLTDWSDGTWLSQMPRPAARTSLLNGTLAWSHQPRMAKSLVRAGALGRARCGGRFGRLGLHRPIETPPDTALPPATAPLRITGTGEFTYLPFRVAERLEQAGADVVVQATSRSPAHIGGALRTALHFTDNYLTGVPNYLYNADASDGRETWICHETPADLIDPALVAALDARLIGWRA